MSFAIIRDVLICLMCALLFWAPLGRRILKALAKDSLPADLPISIGIGMGTWALFTLGLGLVGVLSPAITCGVAAGLFMLLRLDRHVFRPVACGSPDPDIPCDSRLIMIPGILASMCLALVLLSALAPEVAFDSLNVHLPYARETATTHQVSFSPNNWSSVMPAIPLMTYATAFLFSGVTLAKLFNVLCFATCGALVYCFVRRWWGPWHAVLAALLFLSCPVALYEATTALIDLQITLYSAIAVLAFMDWIATNRPALLWLSGIALGLSLGCKYHAAFWMLPLFLIIAWQAYKSGAGKVASLARMALQVFLPALLLFLPWMIRAWHYTGNPVFPVANGLFKSPFFTPAMEAAANAAYQNEGIGRSAYALLKLPWTVTFHPGPFRGTLGFVFLIGMVLVCLRRKTPQLRGGILIAAAYFYQWALTAQEIRYLLPLAPLLSVLAVAGILGTPPISATGQQPAHRPFRRAIPLYIGSLVICVSAITAFPPIYMRLVREWTYWHSYQSPIPYLLGRQNTEEFVKRDVPSIYVYDFINRNLAANDRILLLNDASQFYSKIPTLYSFTVEAEQILLQYEEADVLQKLKESKITHVLLNYNGIAPLPGVVPREGVYFFLDRKFQHSYMEALYSKNNVVLYRIRTSAG